MGGSQDEAHGFKIFTSANRSRKTCCTKTLLTVNPGHMPVTQPVWLTTVAESTNAIPDPLPEEDHPIRGFQPRHRN